MLGEERRGEERRGEDGVRTAMCSLQGAPRLQGGVVAGEDFYRVRLVLLCGGRERAGRVHFRSRFGAAGLGLRASWAGRVSARRRRRVSICASGENGAAPEGGKEAGEGEFVVAGTSRRFSNLTDYGKASGESERSEQSSSNAEVLDRSAGGGSVSGQVEVVNGASQGQEQRQSSEARMPAPWDVGALLAMVWDRLMRNSLVAFITSWPAWQKRRKLERLLSEADANPQDAEKQAVLLAELFKQRLAVRCDCEGYWGLLAHLFEYFYLENGTMKMDDQLNFLQFRCNLSFIAR